MTPYDKKPRYVKSEKTCEHAHTSPVEWLPLCIARRETLFLIKLFNKYSRSSESCVSPKADGVYTQEQRRPLQLVVQDLIGVIIYHVNPKVFLN